MMTTTLLHNTNQGLTLLRQSLFQPCDSCSLYPFQSLPREAIVMMTTTLLHSTSQGPTLLRQALCQQRLGY